MKNSKKLFLLAILSTSFINFNLNCMNNSSPQIVENKSLYLTQNKILGKPIICKGACVIEGNGFDLFFAPNASITVAENSILCLKNITIKDVDQKIKLASNTSKIILMNNVTWKIKNYFIFDLGSFTLLDGTFKILSTNAVQTAHFIYKTPEKSTLQPNSVLKMENVFFTYFPNNQTDLIKTNNLIETSNKSVLYFKNSTILLRQNLQLLKCWIIVDGTLKIMAGKDCVLTLGDGVLKENNAPIDLYPKSQIEDTSGKKYNIEELYENGQYHNGELHNTNVK